MDSAEIAEQVLARCLRQRRIQELSLPDTTTFTLSVSMPGSWLTIECDTYQSTTSELATALDALVRTWARSVERHGDIANVDSAIEPSISLSPPVVGDHFVQWHLNAVDMLPQFLALLVHMLVEFDHSVSKLRDVYVG